MATSKTSKGQGSSDSAEAAIGKTGSAKGFQSGSGHNHSFLPKNYAGAKSGGATSKPPTSGSVGSYPFMPKSPNATDKK